MATRNPAITTWDGAKTPWILGYLLHQLVPSTVAPPTNEIETWTLTLCERHLLLPNRRADALNTWIKEYVKFLAKLVLWRKSYTQKEDPQVWWNYKDIDFNKWPEILGWWSMIIVVQTDIFRGVIIMFNLFELCSMATKKGIPTDLFSSWASSKCVAPRGLLDFSRIGSP